MAAADDHELDPETGLPIGRLVDDPSPAPGPARRVIEGRYARLEPLGYLFASVPDDAARHRAALEQQAASRDPLVFAVIDRATDRAAGQQSFLRITPGDRTIEIGSILWGPTIARTRIATEANYLFARHAFDDLGYRRYEWKCDALNTPSRGASGARLLPAQGPASWVSASRYTA